MKLKIISSQKSDKPDAIIGKTGVIRFKKNVISADDVIKNAYWEIAIDEDEKAIKNIYFIRSKLKSNSVKFHMLNDRIYIDIKQILENLKIKYPTKCKINNFTSGTYTGYVLELENY